MHQKHSLQKSARKLVTPESTLPLFLTTKLVITLQLCTQWTTEGARPITRPSPLGRVWEWDYYIRYTWPCVHPTIGVQDKTMITTVQTLWSSWAHSSTHCYLQPFYIRSVGEVTTVYIAWNLRGSLILRISQIFNRSRKCFNENFWHAACSVRVQWIREINQRNLQYSLFAKI